MNELKDRITKDILNSKDIDLTGLDILMNHIYKNEDYIVMLNTYYLSFFVATHQAPISNYSKELIKRNVFENRTLFLEIANELGIGDMFCFYEETLKEMNYHYQSNAIEILKSTLENSEEAIKDALGQMEELVGTLRE